jgi:hypothetical protein
VGEDDGVAFADEVVDADAAMGGVQLQVGDGVADGEARHGRCDALASSASRQLQCRSSDWWLACVCNLRDGGCE